MIKYGLGNLQTFRILRKTNKSSRNTTPDNRTQHTKLQEGNNESSSTYDVSGGNKQERQTSSNESYEQTTYTKNGRYKIIVDYNINAASLYKRPCITSSLAVALAVRSDWKLIRKKPCVKA